MPRPDIYERPAKVIGAFDRTDELVAASAHTLKEMRQDHLEWYSAHSADLYVNMGDALDHYAQVETAGGKIYASFLGRVAADLTSLLDSEEAMRDLRVKAYAPQLYDPLRGRDQLHTDRLYDEDDLGVRYLTTNQQPTEIPELGTTQPGHIYRMSNAHTRHRRPDIRYSESHPRMLIAFNA